MACDCCNTKAYDCTEAAYPSPIGGVGVQRLTRHDARFVDRAPGVPVATDVLRKTLYELQDELNVLETRLEAVLTPPYPEKDGAQAGPSVTSPLAGSIDGIAGVLGDCVRRVRYLTGRLDV